ncbi:hypothetical protein G6F59_018763 [Rhizopus arrhizus]|nr:hypothetical protein G6F59_018763 [Rhizopus arrhizus]
MPDSAVRDQVRLVTASLAAARTFGSRRSTSAICVRISCSFGGIAASICSSSAATARSASLSSSATGCRAVSAVASCCSALRTRSPAANASGSPA